MNTFDIRITSQFYENYGEADSAHWKAKGSIEFSLIGVSGDVMYSSEAEITQAVMRLLAHKSNPMCRYEFISYEFIFGTPTILNVDDFYTHLGIMG